MFYKKIVVVIYIWITVQQTIKKNELTQSSVIFIRPSYGYLWSVDGFHTHPNHVKTLQSKTDLVVGAIHRNDEQLVVQKSIRHVNIIYFQFKYVWHENLDLLVYFWHGCFLRFLFIKLRQIFIIFWHPSRDKMT